MQVNENVVDIIRCKKNSGEIKNVVFISGLFNILHPGHFRLFRFAKECGDYLVVGVLGNNTSDISVVDEKERLQAVQSIGWVDQAFIVENSVEENIQELQPEIVVKGKEFEAKFNPELDVVQKYGGKVIFCSGESTFSSLDLIRKEITEINYSTINKPKDYLKRHGLTFEKLNNSLDDFSGINVCVIGDSIVDEYASCDPVGMSQEDPTLVVTPVATERFVGGAAIVASHAKSLGASTHFISVTGDDEFGCYIKERLEDIGVVCHFEIDDSRPTTNKRRYRASGKTLLRVNNFRQHQISVGIQKNIIEYLKDNISDFRLLIFSDFNYGILPQNLVDEIVSLCEENDVNMVADSQCSSQVGDISRYRRSMLQTPTEREARLATRDFESGLVVTAEVLRKKTKAKNIVVTLGAEGLLIHAGTDDGQYETDQLPAFNTSPKDPAGAGDVLLVCTSIMMAQGKSIWESVYIGSLAAACQVGRIGNIPLTTYELKQELLE